MRVFAVVHGLAVFLLLAPTAVLAQAADDWTDLPPGEGRDVMVHSCSQCHDPQKAASERRSFSGFQNLVDEMRTNGLTVSDADKDIIAHYLATAFPPSLPPPGASAR